MTASPLNPPCSKPGVHVSPDATGVKPKMSCTQVGKGAAKKLSKEEKQQAREKAQMEKQAAKDGKKRPRDDSKPSKAKHKGGPAAKK